MRRAALSKMRTGAGAFSSEHDEVHEDETDETAELTAREIVNATEILNLKWKEDAGFQLPGRGAYSKDSERTQRHHRQLNCEAATGSKKMTDFFSPKENIQVTEDGSESSKKRARIQDVGPKYDIEEALDALEKISSIGKSQAFSSISAYDHSRHLTTKLYLLRLREGHPKVGSSLSIAKEVWSKGDYMARCIRHWGKEFLETGELRPHQQGAHSKVLSLAEDEDFKEKCLVWLRSQKAENRSPMSLKKFIEEELFPKMTGNGLLKTTIHEDTCRRYLLLWGFTFNEHHKNVYMDGHEREDVKKNRKEWSAFMMEVDKRMSKFEEVDNENGNGTDWKEIEPQLHPGEKKVVQVTHDESCFHAHDGKKMMWLQDGEQILRKKGDGKSVMVSGFLCPCHGPLDMETIEPGANADGYWTNVHMAAHVSDSFSPHFQVFSL